MFHLVDGDEDLTIGPSDAVMNEPRRAAGTRRSEARPLPVLAPRLPAKPLGERAFAVVDLLGWLFGSLFVMWFVGLWAFGSAFCGFDWDNACAERHVAGWAVNATTIAAIVGLALLTRRRFVVATSLISAAALVWLYAAWAMPTMASLPIHPG